MEETDSAAATPTLDQKCCLQCLHVMPATAAYCPHCGAAQGMPDRLRADAAAASEVNGLAIASLVLGILWLYWLGSILAIIFGRMAMKQIRLSNGTASGSGLAKAGIVLGYIGIGLLAVAAIAVAVAIGVAGMKHPTIYR